MSSLSFSFGAFGDILALAQITSTLFSTCYRSINSAEEYRSLKPEVDSLSYIIDCARTNIHLHDDDRLCPATRHAVYSALARSHALVDEMKGCMESYEGYLGGGENVNVNVWGKCVGRVMWLVCGVVKKVERLRKEVLARMVEVNLLLSIARTHETDDRKSDRSSVKNVQTVSASPTYDERTGIQSSSAGTAPDALPSVDKVDPNAAQPANLPSYLQALEAGATPPRETAQATASNNPVSNDTKPPPLEDAANGANRNINPVVITTSDATEIMSPGYATHDSTTNVVPQHDGHPRASVSTMSILKPPMIYANPEGAATIPTPHDASPPPHTTTASNDSIPPQSDASDTIEAQLVLPPSTNLRPSPAPPPISVLKGWFPRDKKPATMFDLAIVSSYRSPSTELSMIVVSPGVSADDSEKGHDLGLWVAPPVLEKRRGEVVKV